MNVRIFDSKVRLGEAAADAGAQAISAAIARNGVANIVVATGASQFEMLAALVEKPIDWSKVHAFHLDEYIGLPETHPASFRGYLKARFTSRLPTLGSFTFIAGDAADIDAELARLNALIAHHPIDVMFAGIGENAHLAFNDPPADFDAKKAFKVVDLDDACRRQQFGEGWFESFEAVPKQAISMSVPQILKSGVIVIAAADARKAAAVRDTLEGSVTPLCPASILQTHSDCRMFFDVPATSLLSRKPAEVEVA
ncbi:glucosamine-6-phosphate deaminase [Xanthobacter sp. VNH20]|uniref:glucosamine-6-phosphate deaminase n=1 Tax=Xanthobacter sp. VNH20 TaxID=3156616 RepID=UPI0032B3C643